MQKLFGGGSGGGERYVLKESITILGWDVNNKSIQILEFFRMWVGSVIICDKANFEVTSWSWEPSKLALSISHHCLDFASKSQITIVRNGLQLDNESRLSSKFDLNIWNSSCVWLGDLYRRIKRQILLAMLTSKLMHSFRFEVFSTLKGSVVL